MNDTVSTNDQKKGDAPEIIAKHQTEFKQEFDLWLEASKAHLTNAKGESLLQKGHMTRTVYIVTANQYGWCWNEPHILKRIQHNLTDNRYIYIAPDVEDTFETQDHLAAAMLSIYNCHANTCGEYLTAQNTRHTQLRYFVHIHLDEAFQKYEPLFNSLCSDLKPESDEKDYRVFNSRSIATILFHRRLMMQNNAFSISFKFEYFPSSVMESFNSMWQQYGEYFYKQRDIQQAQYHKTFTYLRNYNTRLLCSYASNSCNNLVELLFPTDKSKALDLRVKLVLNSITKTMKKLRTVQIAVEELKRGDITVLLDGKYQDPSLSQEPFAISQLQSPPFKDVSDCKTLQYIIGLEYLSSIFQAIIKNCPEHIKQSRKKHKFLLKRNEFSKTIIKDLTKMKQLSNADLLNKAIQFTPNAKRLYRLELWKLREFCNREKIEVFYRIGKEKYSLI